MSKNPKKLKSAKTVSLPKEKRFSSTLPKQQTVLSDLMEEFDSNQNLDNIIETNLENTASDKGVTTGSGSGAQSSLSNSNIASKSDLKFSLNSSMNRL